MAIILSHPMTVQEIRVLQEFRRVSAETMPMTALKAIKHPVGGGDTPVLSLVQKGYLVADEGGQNFSLTGKSRDFIALDVKPDVEASAGADEPAQ